MWETLKQYPNWPFNIPAEAPEIPFLKWIALAIVVGYSAWMVWMYCEFTWWWNYPEQDETEPKRVKVPVRWFRNDPVDGGGTGPY